MKRIIHVLVFYTIVVVSVFFQNCSTRHFIINSTPDSSMVVMCTSSKALIPGERVCGLTPVKNTITFFGKNDTYYFFSMNRNYEADTVFVTRDSALTINFELKKAYDFPAEQPVAERLADAEFCLLPVNAEVFLHKGVGNLDKYVKSEALSKEVTDSLDLKLKTVCHDSSLCYFSLEDVDDYRVWEPVSQKLKTYLLSLNSQLMPYYTLSPWVSGPILEKMPVFQPIPQDMPSEKQYWIYVWCKSIKPTAGRIVGNIAATMATGVVEGYNAAMYGTPINTSNADAFAIDYQTIWMVSVIEPDTGEIISIEHYVLPYELTRAINRDQFIDLLTTIPEKFKFHDHVE